MDQMSSAEKQIFLDTQTAFRQQLNVLTVEVALIIERISKAFGAPIINTESEYYKSVHGSSLEIIGIRRSLELTSEDVEVAGQGAVPVTTENGIQSPEPSKIGETEVDKVGQPEPNPVPVQGPSTSLQTKSGKTTTDQQPKGSQTSATVDVQVIDISDSDTDSDEAARTVRHGKCGHASSAKNISRKGVRSSKSTGNLQRKAVVKIRKADTDAVEAYMRSKNPPQTLDERRTRIELCSNSPNKDVAESSKARGQKIGLNIRHMAVTAPGIKTRRSVQLLRGGVRAERRFKCQYCEASFTRTNHRDRHERIHTGVKPFNCRFCPTKFARKDARMRHERIHKGERPGPHKCHKCHYCVKKFAARWNRTRHERIHTGAKPYRCRHCKARFRHINTKISHERLQTGEKPFKCSYCDKKFVQRVHQVNHEQSHTGDKPYKCRYCKASFSQQYPMNCHERIHTGEKPYSCQFCDKTFNTSTNVLSHLRTHTKEKPFQCQICNMCFALMPSLKMHVANHH